MSLNTHTAPPHTMPTFGPLASHAAPYLKLTLPAKFYNVPADAPALFSTRNGTRVKRQLLNPPPAPVVRSDFDEEVKRMAALLGKELPQVAGLIRNPTSWKDLYYFFDSVDLWVEGAVFLYFVISHISRDNVVAQDAHYRMQQSAMIFQYAGNWVADNADRLAKLPSDTDFLTLFGPSQRADIRGLGGHELDAMREAICFHHARLREKYNSATRSQCVDAPRQTTTTSANTIQKCVAPHISQIQPVASAPVPVPNRVDQYNHNVESIPRVADTQTMACPQVMEPQYMRANAIPTPPRAPGVSHKDNSGQQPQARVHGYSHGAGSGSRSQTTGYPPQGGFRPPSAEQRVVGNAPYGSPPRTTPNMGKPVYIHNPQRVSPPRFQEASTNTRNYSEPYNGRNGVSNDARLWNDSQLPPRQTQTGQERFNKQGMQYNSYHQRSLSAPFKDHPDARISGKASTFFYKKETMEQKNDFYNHRTLYVHGIPVEMFASHALKEMMSEVGTVESISYLYSNPYLGPAFVTFAEESAIQAGIARFNGISMHSGRQLEVKLPEKNYKFSRDRSDSQSSQSYSNYNPTHPGRPNPRGFRKNSVSSRQYNRPYQTVEGAKYADNSPDAFKHHSGPHNPHSHAPQIQGMGPPPYTMPIPVEHLHSSIYEIMQHHTALDRLIVTQMPLEQFDHYSGGNRKSTGPPYEKFGFNRKENSPVKSASKNTTPDVTPKKEGFLQHMSAPHTPEGMSSNHQSIDLVETLRASARQKSLIFPLNINASNNESKESVKHFTANIQQPCINHVKLATDSGPDPTTVKSERPAKATAPTAAIESIGGGQRPDGGVKSKKTHKNKKKQANLRREISDSSKSTVATTVSSVETTSPTLTDSTDYKSTETSFSEVSSRNHSFASAKSVVSLSTTNESSIDGSLPSTPTPVIKHSKASSSSTSNGLSTPKPTSSRNQHVSRPFKNQGTTSDSHHHTGHATDANKSNDKRSSGEAVKLGSETSGSGNSKINEAPISSFGNHEEWPALDHVIVTPSRVAGCKHSTASSLHAITGHHAPAISKSSNAVIPALPLNMIPQRRNSNDIAESKAWPRVRRCVGK